MDEKLCKGAFGCGQSLPKSKFYKRPDGFLSTMCMGCQNKYYKTKYSYKNKMKTQKFQKALAVIEKNFVVALWPKE